MPNGRCKVHGGKSTGPRTPEGIEQAGKLETRYYSREAKAERSRLRAAIFALCDLCDATPRGYRPTAAIRGFRGR